MYAAWLLSLGFAIAAARDGVEGLACARAIQPDAILMDIAMPRMDGIEATRRLKADTSTAAIPVLAISAHATQEFERAVVEAGAVEFISKSSDLDYLAARVRCHSRLTSVCSRRAPA